MSKIDNIKAVIADEMQSFAPFFKQIMHSDNRLLNFVINYTLKTKGKQMRPMLVFLCAKTAGEVHQSTYVAASLIELLHTATLIHDDVVDESFYRRDMFSVFALWKAKIAVLTGDFFLSKGLLVSIEKNEIEILKIVSKAVGEMAEGELLQLEKSRRLNITEQDYYQIIRQKTATLIAACTASGAYSSGANQEKVELMSEFGFKIGMAFQIKDDLFDYQKTGSIGKPKYNDIQERKMTLPVIAALKKADKNNQAKIMAIFRKKKNSPGFLLRLCPPWRLRRNPTVHLPMKILKHLHLILKHRHHVIANASHCGIFWHSLKHDLSKFSPSEFIPSVRNYSGSSSPVISERNEHGGFSLIAQHHTKRNKHHWEYWTDYYMGDVIALAMPWKYATEYVCDMISASYCYDPKGFTRGGPHEYFSQRMERYYLAPLTREYILWCLSRYRDLGFQGLKKKDTKAKYAALLAEYGDNYRYRIHAGADTLPR